MSFVLLNVYDGCYCLCYFAWKVFCHTFTEICLHYLMFAIVTVGAYNYSTAVQLFRGSQCSVTQHLLSLLTKHFYSRNLKNMAKERTSLASVCRMDTLFSGEPCNSIVLSTSTVDEFYYFQLILML